MKTNIPEHGYSYIYVPQDDFEVVYCSFCGEPHTHPEWALSDKDVPCIECIKKMRLDFWCSACGCEWEQIGLPELCPNCKATDISANDIYINALIHEHAF